MTTYVFQIYDDYHGPGSNWPVTKLADYDAIPEPLKARIMFSCHKCVVALLDALWGARYKDLHTHKARDYLNAPTRVSWRYLLNPGNPLSQKYMDRHMKYEGP